jgi:tetratricopeptide (TPR) repeat protein
VKSTSSFKHGLARVRRAWLARDFAKALAEVDKLLKQWPDNPHLLVLWADLIQLQDTDGEPTIEGAKAAYRRAIALNADSPEPHVGLGHYLFAVDDDPKAASECFAITVELCRSWLREALLAQAEALMELGRKQEAFDCRAQAHWLDKHNGKNSSGTTGKKVLNRLDAARKSV